MVPTNSFAFSGSERPGREITMLSAPCLRMSASATPHLSMRLRMVRSAWSSASVRNWETAPSRSEKVTFPPSVETWLKSP